MTERVLKTLYVLFLLPILLLNGCNGSDSHVKKTAENKIVTDFSADFAAKLDTLELKGTITLERQGIMNLRVTYPDSLNSLSVNIRNAEMELIHGDLKCTADEAYLPERSFPRLIMAVYDGICDGRAKKQSDEGETTIYKLSAAVGECTLISDKDSRLTRAEIPNESFEINFYYK